MGFIAGNWGNIRAVRWSPELPNSLTSLGIPFKGARNTPPAVTQPPAKRHSGCPSSEKIVNSAGRLHLAFLKIRILITLSDQPGLRHFPSQRPASIRRRLWGPAPLPLHGDIKSSRHIQFARLRAMSQGSTFLLFSRIELASQRFVTLISLPR